MGDPELSFRLHRVLFCVEHKSTIPSAPLSRGPAVAKRGNLDEDPARTCIPPRGPPSPPGSVHGQGAGSDRQLVQTGEYRELNG